LAELCESDGDAQVEVQAPVAAAFVPFDELPPDRVEAGRRVGRFQIDAAGDLGSRRLGVAHVEVAADRLRQVGDAGLGGAGPPLGFRRLPAGEGGVGLRLRLVQPARVGQRFQPRAQVGQRRVGVVAKRRAVAVGLQRIDGRLQFAEGLFGVVHVGGDLLGQRDDAGVGDAAGTRRLRLARLGQMPHQQVAQLVDLGLRPLRRRVDAFGGFDSHALVGETLAPEGGGEAVDEGLLGQHHLQRAGHDLSEVVLGEVGLPEVSGERPGVDRLHHGARCCLRVER
jgi:hypothetical protein